MLGKIFGAGLGWVLGGPIGAVVGVAVGSLFDNTKVNIQTGSPRPHSYSTGGDIHMVLLVLSAAIMKADGKVLKSELDFVKRFFIQSFGEQVASEQILILKEILKQPLQIEQICAQISANMRINEKRLILQYLFGIAMADQHLHDSESTLLKEVAHKIGISATEFLSMQAQFAPEQSTESDYQIMGVNSSVSNEDLKKAYRKLVVKHHPDKVAHLGEEHVKTAKNNFQKIQLAYERIQKSRGI